MLEASKPARTALGIKISIMSTDCTTINIYKRTNVMQLGSMFICKCNIALHVSDAFCFHLQEHLETVEAASVSDMLQDIKLT